MMLIHFEKLGTPISQAVREGLPNPGLLILTVTIFKLLNTVVAPDKRKS